MTRVECVWRLALGILGGWAVMVVSAAIAPFDNPTRYAVIKDFGAVIAMILLVLPHFPGWMSLFIAVGSWRPGFPLYLLYTRPVRTAVLVGLPMAYLTVVPAAIYLVSALVLRVTSGYPFPLLPVAAWIAALALVQTATNWSSRSMVTLMLANIVASSAWILFADHRLDSFPNGSDWHDSPSLWPAIFDFPLTDYALIAMIGMASFGVTALRVARDRHGDVRAVIRRKVKLAGLEWLSNLFRSCPTSSATRAQIWYELRAGSLGVLLIGLALAILTPLVFAVSAPVVWLRPFARSWAVLSVMGVLFLGTNNGLGLHIHRGRLCRNAFESIQAAGSARLAGVRVIVRAVCGLSAMIVLGVSLWGSLSFIAVGKGYEPVRSWQRAIEAVGTLTGSQQVALAVVACIGFLVVTAVFSALWTFWERYFRRTNIAAALLLLYGLALVLLALAERSGTAPAFLVEAIFGATQWIAAAAMVFTTVYLVWRGLEERLVTLRYVGVALLVSAAFGVAWLTMLRATGVQLAGIPTMAAFWKLSPALLPLMAGVFAPWALSRLRHI